MAVYAAADVGSNSVRLLVAAVEEQGHLVPLYTDLVTTRLGRRNPKGYLEPEAVAHTLAVLRRFRDQAGEFAPRALDAVATSAVREAVDGREFMREALACTGWPLRSIDGQEEAVLSYRGAVAGLGLKGAAVVDIGGGSTEVIYPGEGGLLAQSQRLGAVRCTLSGWTPEGLAAELAPALRSLPPHLPLVGVGGTVTTLAAMVHRLPRYDPRVVHGTHLGRGEVEETLELLRGLSPTQRRRLPGLEPERADIMEAGLAILRAVLQASGRSSLLVSDAGLLHGLVAELAAGERGGGARG